MASNFPPSNQRPAGTKAQRSANPYAAAAAYAAAADPDAAAEKTGGASWLDDDAPPPGFGLGGAGPRPASALGPQPGKPAPKKRGKKKRRRGFGIPNIRLLPVTIFVVFLMLSVRVNDIWRGLEQMNVLGLNSSEAQQPPPPGGRKKGQSLPALPSNPLPAGAPSAASGTQPAAQSAQSSAQTAAQLPSGQIAPAQTPAEQAATKDAGMPEMPPAVPAQGAAGGEPPTFTQNELDVLQKLSERRDALDARERDLELRENLVKAAEARIDKKVSEMKAMQTNVEGMFKQIDQQDDEKLKSLAKMYESMKPKDAGKIFDQLDLSTLVGVVPHMKEQKAGLIMANMSPDKAKDLTDAIAQRRGAKAEGLQPLN